jgi:hypothetical protein
MFYLRESTTSLRFILNQSYFNLLYRKVNVYFLTFLVCCLAIKATASNIFTTHTNYANKWVIITATENVSGKCGNRNELSTNYFTGLKNGLFICVADVFEDKNNALSKLNSFPKGSAYIKYTGSYYDLSKMDSTLLCQDLFFTTTICDSILLQCLQHKKQPDPIQLQQGNTTSYSIQFKTYKTNKKNVTDTTINVISCTNFDKIQLDSNTVAITFVESAVDESSLHIICWSTAGQNKFYKEVFNSVSEGEAEVVSLEKIGQKYALVIVIKVDGQSDKRQEMYWDGKKFK